MEKAHGWVYHRSKNTGRGSVRASSHASPPQTIQSINPSPSAVPALSPPASAAAASNYASPSPFYPQYGLTDNNSANGLNNDTFMADFPLFPDASHSGLEGISPQSQPFGFDAFYSGLQASDRNEYAPISNLTTGQEGSDSSILGGSPPESGNPCADPGFHWDGFDDEYMAMNAQLLTPQSVSTSAFDSAAGDLCLDLPKENVKIASISPCGKGNVMLYSPPSQSSDEGFCETYLPAQKPTQDFTLFGAHFVTAPSQPSNSMEYYLQNCNAMFPPLGDDISVHSDSSAHMTSPDITMTLDEIMNQSTL